MKHARINEYRDINKVAVLSADVASTCLAIILPAQTGGEHGGTHQC